METQTQLAVVNNSREVTVSTWQMIKEIAPVMHQSRLFGVTSEAQATAIMIKGHEVGLGFAASFEFIKEILGSVQLSPRGAMALLLNDPRITDIKINRLVDAKDAFIGYECTMTRESKLTYTARFTLDDAKRAGLIKPDSGWTKYPENMCQWRAVGFCADVVAPDITAGMTSLMKMPEHYGVALSEGGDVIDVEAKEPAPAHTELNLTTLAAQYGAQKVLDANDGKMPMTDEELVSIAAKLEAEN